MDDIATIQAEVASPNGNETLKSTKVEIETFDTGSKRLFPDDDAMGQFMQTYYRQPEPARLIPLVEFAITNGTKSPRQGHLKIFMAFLSASLKSDPVAAHDFQERIRIQPMMIRAFGLLALRSAGYDINGVIRTLNVEERQKFLSLPPLQNPYDLDPTTALFSHLDMLWATFEATGQFEPVKTVASMLSWHADYESFKKMRAASNDALTPTPAIVRGIVYTASGWSLKSYQQNDPLVADYIDHMLESPETSVPVKSELGQLSTNPAFNRQ